ncbi:uncharacterized protein LOC141488378 [Macrotis lagotis]|uniref:uncharacterized protein LOC141488378 n=1 Tax=Macrotis lagotis TaxID=92651 RepID=UPI003D684D41
MHITHLSFTRRQTPDMFPAMPRTISTHESFSLSSYTGSLKEGHKGCKPLGVPEPKLHNQDVSTFNPMKYSVRASQSFYSKKLHLPPQNFQDCGKEIPCKRREDLSQQSCPEGFHCSGLPSVPCPPGTFLSSKGPRNFSNCHKCPRGFFNHWPGQDACFPCGSEATQSEEGQDTCICRGFGRVFQPSDGQCPCFPGYKDVGEPSGCVQQEYGICKDGATRNQEGQCLTKEEWTSHCAQEVCATPRHAHGFDSLLGLCLCWGMDLDEECVPPCQGRQRHILQLTCHEGIPRISSIDDDDRQLSYFLDRPLSPRAAGFPCTYEQNLESSPVYVIRTDGRGFLGLTRPGPELLYSLHQSLGNPRPPVQVPDSSLEASSGEALSSLWALNLSSKEPGILNPTACIHTHDTLAFLVTHEHYPEYDLGHLYNTLGEYDWGDFRALTENILLRLHRPFLFLHQFQQPGVYVFRLNSNKHRKMVCLPSTLMYHLILSSISP